MNLTRVCALIACSAWCAEVSAQAAHLMVTTRDFSAVRTGSTFIGAEENAWSAAEDIAASEGYGDCIQKHLVTWYSGQPSPTTPTASATVTCSKDLNPPPPPPPEPPGEPPTLLPIQRSVDGARHVVSWRSNTGCGRHALSRSINGGAWQEVHKKDGTTSWDADVFSPATYQYKVLDLCYTAYHVWSAISSFVISPAPITPAPPASSAVVGPNHTITWSASPGADLYRLDRGAGDGWESVYIGPNTSWSVFGMPVGTYRYRVIACTNGACSAPSGITELRVVATMAPIITYMINN